MSLERWTRVEVVVSTLKLCILVSGLLNILNSIELRNCLAVSSAVVVWEVIVGETKLKSLLISCIVILLVLMAFG